MTEVGGQQSDDRIKLSAICYELLVIGFKGRRSDVDFFRRVAQMN